MFKPWTVFVGLRYMRAKRKNHFISFISAMSVLGIALGITVLITVLSVMNGFDEKIKSRVFGMAPHLTLTRFGEAFQQNSPIIEAVRQVPGVSAVSPYVAGQGILTAEGREQPILFSGVDPTLEANISVLHKKMIEGQLSSLQPKKFDIVLGETLADRLGVGLGDKVVLMVPKASVSLAGVMPRFKRFTVSGIFKVGQGFNFDSGWAFLHLQDAQALLQMPKQLTGVRLKLADVFQAGMLARQLKQRLPDDFQVNTWMQQYGALFHAISMERTMMFIILLLIVAVAAFNLVSMLVMVVTDKRSDIAILMTLGATPKAIMRTFMIQGSALGLLGIILGVFGGVTLAWHVTEVVTYLQTQFGLNLFESSVYYVDYLPSKLLWRDVLQITGAAWIMSFLATLYPAWRAASTHPAKALRYE